MAYFLCPFLITDTGQIPDKLIEEYNLGLEAICPDGKLLNNLKRIDKQIKKVNDFYPNRLKSFHFPTENAAYFKNTKIKRQLLQLIDLCSKNKVGKIIIHSNYFQSLGEFNPGQLETIRKRFIDLFKEIDNKIRNMGVTLLVENMPIIGNHGDDFDSIFVFPHDFLAFKKFKNIKINWDLGHWALTMKMSEHMKKLSFLNLNEKVGFFDFKNIITEIEHCHLSSFKGLPLPMTYNVCYEGVPPHLGDYNPLSLKRGVLFLNSRKPNIQVSLEIAEQDYHNRKNLTKTLVWLRFNRLI